MTGSINMLLNQLTSKDAVDSAHSIRSEASGSSTSTSDGADSASISANDFLTLLVTEMKNQDPTANTDPNEYINQLVQVNSLEQLISINQTLTDDSTSVSTDKGVMPGRTQVALSQAIGSGDTAHHPSASFAAPSASGTPDVSEPVSGNLTIPTGNAAAQRVAQALGGQANR
ncbi:MAG TPA: flagellar hook capping FlgD N-terminal domain-containing protein [Terracidiphilus sp.]